MTWVVGIEFVMFASVCAIAWLSLTRYGSVLLRLETIERELVTARLQGIMAGAADSPDESAVHPSANAPPPLAKSRINRSGLSAGASAPPFTAARLVDGRDWALSEEAGRRVVLMFMSPDCAPCTQVLERVTPLLAKRSDRVSVVVVSRGSADANSAKFSGLAAQATVVLQKAWEVSKLYATFSLPSAYVLEADGTLLTNVVTGPAEVVSLVEQYV